MNYMMFTKAEDGMRLYVQREDIISVEETESGSIIHLVYGCYEVMESVDQIFNKVKVDQNIKFSNN